MLCLHSDERKNAAHREQGKAEEVTATLVGTYLGASASRSWYYIISVFRTHQGTSPRRGLHTVAVTSSCCLLLFLWSFILNINTILSTKVRYTKKNNLKKAYTN